MNKKFLAGLLLSVCVGLCVGAFTSCRNEEESSSSNSAVSVLPPEVTANDNGIFWTSAVNATGYKYRVNNGEYTTVSKETHSIAFPTVIGAYTLEIFSLAGNTVSEKAEFSFSVGVKTASCTQNDNELLFAGENIYYSVNGGAEAMLDETNALDFSATEVGTQFSVTYYAKGGFWSSKDTTYYIDGNKQTVSLTSTEMLNAPVLTVQNNAVVWNEVTNALQYQVTVDGVSATVDNANRSVALPETVGAHTIRVKALENGAYKTSRESVYDMTTVATGVPSVNYSVEDNALTWSEDYLGYMACDFGTGTYEILQNATVTLTANMKLRINAVYDEVNRTYALPSKTLAVVQRATPQITFDKSGVIAWDSEATTEEKKYAYSFSIDGENYVELRANSLNVSEKPAGQYTFKIYGAQYIFETETSAVFYVPSEVAEISVEILPAPVLTFTTGKLLWTVSPSATAYEYKMVDGEWQTAQNDGYVAVNEFAQYFVRAVGDNTADNYTVTSLASDISFDPTLQKSGGVNELARFNDAKYSNFLIKPTAEQATATGVAEIITSSSNATEQTVLSGATNGGVLKLTAGASSPKNTNLWGNSDGFAFTLFENVHMVSGGKIVFRVYLKSNTARETGWLYPNMDTPVNLEGRIIFALYGPNAKDGSKIYQTTDYTTVQTDTWVEYALSLDKIKFKGGTEGSTNYDGMSAVSGVSVLFQNNAKQGDVLYVDSVTFTNSPQSSSYKISVDENVTDRFYFSSSAASIMEQKSDSDTTTVLHFVDVKKTDGIMISFNSLAFKAGTKIKITMKATGISNTSGGGIYLDTAKTNWKTNFTTDDTEYKTYTLNFTSDFTLDKLVLYSYGNATGDVCQIYIESVEILPVIAFDGTEMNFAENANLQYAVSNQNGVEIVADGTKTVLQAKNVYQATDVSVYFNDIALSANDKIVVTMKTVSTATNGGGLYLGVYSNANWKKNFTSGTDDGYAAYEITVSEATTLSVLTFHVYNPNVVHQIYIQKIEIIKS